MDLQPGCVAEAHSPECSGVYRRGVWRTCTTAFSDVRRSGGKGRYRTHIADIRGLFHSALGRRNPLYVRLEV